MIISGPGDSLQADRGSEASCGQTAAAATVGGRGRRPLALTRDSAAGAHRRRDSNCLSELASPVIRPHSSQFTSVLIEGGLTVAEPTEFQVWRAELRRRHRRRGDGGPGRLAIRSVTFQCS